VSTEKFVGPVLTGSDEKKDSPNDSASAGSNQQFFVGLLFILF
jgi:hypothetical protein